MEWTCLWALQGRMGAVVGEVCRCVLLHCAGKVGLGSCLRVQSGDAGSHPRAECHKHGIRVVCYTHCAAKVIAARCNGLCTALRWLMQRSAPLGRKGTVRRECGVTDDACWPERRLGVG